MTFDFTYLKFYCFNNNVFCCHCVVTSETVNIEQSGNVYPKDYFCPKEFVMPEIAVKAQEMLLDFIGLKLCCSNKIFWILLPLCYKLLSIRHLKFKQKFKVPTFIISFTRRQMKSISKCRSYEFLFMSLFFIFEIKNPFNFPTLVPKAVTKKAKVAVKVVLSMGLYPALKQRKMSGKFLLSACRLWRRKNDSSHVLLTNCISFIHYKLFFYSLRV